MTATSMMHPVPQQLARQNRQLGAPALWSGELPLAAPDGGYLRMQRYPG